MATSQGMNQSGDAMRPTNTSGMRGAAMSTRMSADESGTPPKGPNGAMAGGTGGTMRGSVRATGGGGGTGPTGPLYDIAGPNRRTCAAQDVHRQRLTDDPAYRTARAAIENATRSRVSQRGDKPRFSGVARIPVVVHVVHNTADQNLSMAQIESQINVLNRDFRATNPDVSTVPSVFGNLVADARIEFHLATTDPDGNPTDGVTRTQTSQPEFGTDDGIKSAAKGGRDPWPTDRYLNIWTGQLGGGLLGYAQFPGGPPETDGVVIRHSAFGTTGTVTPPFHLGRTATHEIGHFFNLFHIWGDDGDGCGGSDEVDDTPNAGGPNYGTPSFPKLSCNNAPNGDLFVNYMDYVDDPAMVMFTRGQAARMEACLDTVRTTLAGQGAQPVPAGPVVSWSSDRIDAFVLGTDRAVYHKWWDGAAWGPSPTGYEYMGGICLNEPEVVAWGPNRLDAFVLGTDSAVYHKWWDGTQWGPSIDGYENLGGICTSPPEVVAWGPNRLDLFVLGTDNAVYHKWWDGSQWGPSTDGFEYMGGVCASPPTAVAWGENRLDLFVIGTDHALYHKWWDGKQWGPSVTDWEYMGGVCTSAPTVVSWGSDRLDVFVTGTDHALYHKWWDGSQWGPSVTDYEYMGGICVGQPRVTAWSENRLDVFVTGTDSALYHKWWDGKQWSPSVDGYEYLGGVISEFRTPAPDDISSLSNYASRR